MFGFTYEKRSKANKRGNFKMELEMLAKCYRKLSSLKVIITIDGISSELRFKQNALYHLGGFHYLKDYTFLKSSKEKELLLTKLEQSNDFRKHIKKSKYYPELKERIYYFNMILHLLLEDNVNIWPNNPQHSKIVADYVYIYEYKTLSKETIFCHLFIKKVNNSHHIPISFFKDKQNKCRKDFCKSIVSKIPIEKY